MTQLADGFDLMTYIPDSLTTGQLQSVQSGEMELIDIEGNNYQVESYSTQQAKATIIHPDDSTSTITYDDLQTHYQFIEREGRQLTLSELACK